MDKFSWFPFFVKRGVHCQLTSSMGLLRLLMDVSLILLANGSYTMTGD